MWSCFYVSMPWRQGRLRNVVIVIIGSNGLVALKSHAALCHQWTFVRSAWCELFYSAFFPQHEYSESVCKRLLDPSCGESRFICRAGLNGRPELIGEKRPLCFANAAWRKVNIVKRSQHSLDCRPTPFMHQMLLNFGANRRANSKLRWTLFVSICKKSNRPCRQTLLDGVKWAL